MATRILRNERVRPRLKCHAPGVTVGVTLDWFPGGFAPTMKWSPDNRLPMFVHVRATREQFL